MYKTTNLQRKGNISNIIEVGIMNDLQLLKRLMPPRYRSKLAEKFNVCEKYIDCIFRGERNRPDIVDEAIRMAKDYQVHLKFQMNEIEKLITENMNN